MTETAKALYNFWSSFKIPAYVEEHVPDDAVLPYITYTVSEPEWRYQGSMQARVWYRGDSFAQLNLKVDEIANKIGEGYSISTSGGAVVLYKEINFAQLQPFPEDSMIRVMYLNILLDACTT